MGGGGTTRSVRRGRRGPHRGGKGEPPIQRRCPRLLADLGQGPRSRQGWPAFLERSGGTSPVELSRLLPDDSARRSHRLRRLLAHDRPRLPGSDAGGHGRKRVGCQLGSPPDRRR